MPTDIEAFIGANGFVTRPQMLQCGYGDKAIAALRKRGMLVRIGPGLYTGSFFSKLTPEEQHLLRVRAVNTRFDRGDVVFSHQSAALLLGAAVWGVGLEQVHLTRSDGARGRHQAGVVHHVGVLADEEIIEIDGIFVTSPTRTAWDLGVSAPRDAAVVTADSLVNQGLTTLDDLAGIGGENLWWPGGGRARATLGLVRVGAESAGESRSRLVCYDFDLPEPVLQLPIVDEHGSVFARSDMGWPDFRHLCEFDGMVKYRRSEDLIYEKSREDKARGLYWGMSRIIWYDLDARRRKTLAEGIWYALNQSRRLYGPLAG